MPSPAAGGRQVKKKVSEAQQSTAPRRDGARRRKIITDALYRLILSQGYAEITLKDLAAAAGMSISHFLYYYPGKEAVLIELYEGIVDNVFSSVFPDDSLPPSTKINNLVQDRFIKHSETDIWTEIKALALHRPELRRILENTFKERQAHLQYLFAATPRQPGFSKNDTAELAGAIWEGLLDSVQLGRLTEAEAQKLFRKSLTWLAGLGAPSKTSSPQGVRKPGKKAARDRSPS